MSIEQVDTMLHTIDFTLQLKRDPGMTVVIVITTHCLFSFTLKLRKPWTLKIFLECSFCFDQSRARPGNHRKWLGLLVIERIWFSICCKRPQDLTIIITYRNLDCYSFYLRATCTLQVKKCLSDLWLSSCSCIVAGTADCGNQCLLFFNSLVYCCEIWNCVTFKICN